MERSNGFAVSGFPGAGVLDSRVERVLKFFDLPERERMAIATRRHRPEARHCYRGFFPLPVERGWAHNEIFDFGPRTTPRAPAGHPAKVFLEETNQWPETEPFPGWREDAQVLFGDIRRLSVEILTALTVHPQTGFNGSMRSFADGNGTLRVLHYPPAPSNFVAANKEAQPVKIDAAGRCIITHRHVDACVLSVLWQDEVRGLQYQGRDGSWYEVPPGGGRLSVHAGRALELMTQGSIQGTPHRVVGTGRNRYSMGFFLEPAFETQIAVCDGTPVTYADHLKDDFADLPDYADVMGEAVTRSTHPRGPVPSHQTTS